FRIAGRFMSSFQKLFLAVVVMLWAVGCGDAKSGGLADTAVGGGDGGNSKSNSSAANPTLARFVDMAPACGVDFQYRDGQEAGHYAILESLGGGAALFDYDGDG